MVGKSSETSDPLLGLEEKDISKPAPVHRKSKQQLDEEKRLQIKRQQEINKKLQQTKQLPVYSFSALSFLVVDQDRRTGALARTILRNFFAKEILFAVSCAEAMNLLQTSKIDIVLSELKLDGVNGGIDLIRNVRSASFEEYQRVPIVIMTAEAKLENVLLARDAGVNEFLAKPMSPVSIYKHICSVISPPRDFLEVNDYTGPDRRRRKELITKERRSAGGEKQLDEL